MQNNKKPLKVFIRRKIYPLLSLLAFYLTWLLFCTLRVKVIFHADYHKDKQYLGAFWHGKMFVPMFAARTHQTKMAVLVSPSKDGDIISSWLKKLGYETVRGSSRRNNVSSLVEMLRKLKAGYSIGIIVDGPLGPAYKVKPGIVHMAQKLEVEIVPVGVAIKRKWIFKRAWDRFELPKPFSEAVMFSANPIKVPAAADLQTYLAVVEQAILKAQQTAEEMLGIQNDTLVNPSLDR